MAYKVFISHSTKDQVLVLNLAQRLKKLGVGVFVAEWNPAPGERLDTKVFTHINNADCMIVLLTKNGIRSNWVHQEVGYAIRAGKPVIPFVEKGIDNENLGALQGREYIEYDPFHPEQALNRASTYVNSLKLRKEEQGKILFILGVIYLFLLFRK